MTLHEEVTVTMNAPVETVWSLVSDVTRIGEFSPETFEAEWIGTSTGEVGARFRGHVRRNEVGPTYWTTCTVVEYEPERAFTVGVGPSKNPVTRWGYRLAPVPQGVDVTETFDFTPALWARIYWLVIGPLRRRRIRKDMRRTLEAMRTVAENEAPSTD